MTLLEACAVQLLGEAKTVRASLMELVRVARSAWGNAAKLCPTCKSGIGHCYDLEGACACRCYEAPCETRKWARKSKKNTDPTTGRACTKIGPHAMCSITRPFRVCMWRRFEARGWCETPSYVLAWPLWLIFLAACALVDRVRQDEDRL